MNDCPRVEFRDRLPELVHERLDVLERAAVMAHVEACADCRAELELLRGMRAVLAVAPPLNVDRIVQSLPTAGARLMSTGSRRRFHDWRLAAAAAVLFVGGASVAAYMRSGVATPRPSANTSAVESLAVKPPRSIADTPKAVRAPDSELAVGGELSDLSASELTRLLSDIERLEPLPQTEPDVGTVSTEAPGDSS